MNSFQVYILAAGNAFYEGPCESLKVPVAGGSYGILAGHSNMIGAIVPGVLSYRIPGEDDSYAAVSEGMVKVEGNEVLVLVDTAERPEDIDINRAERAAAEAREELLRKQGMREYRSAQANLARAVNRLKVGTRKGHLD